MATKGVVIYGLSRLSVSAHGDAIRIAGVLAQGGEFAFVLFGAAATSGIMSPMNSSLLIATVTVSLGLTPLVFSLAQRLAERKTMAEGLEGDFRSEERPVGKGCVSQGRSRLAA